MKKILLLTVTIILTVSTDAQLLWKVKAPGSEYTSYIFGTHHTAPVKLADLPAVDSVLKQVSIVFGEIDMALLNTPEFQQQVMNKVVAPADSTLSKLYTAEELSEIDAMLAKYTNGSLNTATLDRFTPAFISTTLTMIVSSQAIKGYSPMQQIDTEIQTVAKALGKEVKGLETPEFQINVLYGQPISRQAEKLLETARSDEDLIRATAMLTETYLNGDLTALHSQLTDTSKGIDAVDMDRLINDRNAAWAEFLCGLIPVASVMIVVGAGHLPGTKGIINLLRDADYEVTPI